MTNGQLLFCYFYFLFRNWWIYLDSRVTDTLICPIIDSRFLWRYENGLIRFSL